MTSWSKGVSSDANLVNRLLDNAIALLGDDEHPAVYSDWNCYSPDNLACEGFFGRLKTKCFIAVVGKT